VKILVFGAGSIGIRHALNIVRLGHHVEVVEPFPSRRSEFEDTHTNIAIHPTIPQGDFNAAVVCVPISAHAKVLNQCLANGLPIYIEKPIGKDTNIKNFRQLASMNNLPLIMVGYQLRFHEAVEFIREWRTDSPPISYKLACRCDMSSWVGASRNEDFLLELSHEIDLALHLGATELNDCEINMRLRRAKLYFTNCTVLLDGSFKGYQREWECKSANDDFMKSSFRSPESLGGDMYIKSMNHFLSAVERGAKTTSHGCTFTEAINVLDVIAQVRNAYVERTVGAPSAASSGRRVGRSRGSE
tara:strand:- start:5579 stop:6481 length:903 start_codon:yes stop_codon:yes gene_type:complete